MKRPVFVGMICGAAFASALPAAWAQQSAIPVIGFLDTGPLEAIKANPAFRDGLKAAGYVDGAILL